MFLESGCCIRKKPSVGLLNIGAEAMKGNVMVQEAAQILAAMPHLNFYGFVEGDDITAGTTDIVVTDGFTGNVALKNLGRNGQTYPKHVGRIFKVLMAGKIRVFDRKNPLFKSSKKRIDPRLYNGALFLGLQGIAVKSHGGTDAVGFRQCYFGSGLPCG
jgi:glycerol-3-phosphate acyltransferase PlsX